MPSDHRSVKAWHAGLSAETGFYDVAELRFGAVAHGGYQWGRWSVELGAGFMFGADGAGSIDKAVFTQQVGSVAIKRVLPGMGFLSRLGAGFDVWRMATMTASLGCQVEFEYSEPMIRFGWRQPMVPVHIHVAVTPVDGTVVRRGESKLHVDGTFVVALGAMFVGL